MQKLDQTVESRPCPRCNGTGKYVTKGFTWNDERTGKQTVYPDKEKTCYECNGTGKFLKPNVPEIIANIKGRKGLRSARPKDRRAYYVWRLARFHGGKDVTMPVCADMELGRDPYKPTLDLLADAVAKRVFGTDKAAAYRWGRALGYNLPRVEGLPASAESCGPVVMD